MDIDKTDLIEWLGRGIFMAEGFDLVFGWMWKEGGRRKEGGRLNDCIGFACGLIVIIVADCSRVQRAGG